MASVKAALPGPRVPLADQSGTVNSAWYSYFQALHNRTGGNPVDKVEEAAQVGAVAQTAADNANAAAAVAQAAADAAGNGLSPLQNLIDSHVVGCIIHGHDDGTDADIIVTAHDRRYADGTTVSVNLGSVVHLAYSGSFWIYYDDPARAGGAVTYQVQPQATLTDAYPSVTFPDRHFVGTCGTPAALDPATDGTPNEL